MRISQWKSPLAALFILCSALATPSIAGTPYEPGEPYQYVSQQELGQQNIYFHDAVGAHGNGGFGKQSFLLNLDIWGAAKGRPQIDPTCTSVNEGTCATAKQIQWNAQLPQCASTLETNCISGFGVINDDGSRTAGIFKSYFPSIAENKFVGDPTLKIPTGATANVYEVQSDMGVRTSFMVSSFLSGVYQRAQGVNQLAGFNLSITPVLITPARNPGPCVTNETSIGLKGGPCADDGYVQLFDAASKTSFFGEAGGVGADCGEASARIFAKANFDKLCATQIAFPSMQKYYVTLRLNNPPSGWMHGRLTDPTISVKKATSSSDYEFIGKPVLVPVLYQSNYWKDLPASITSQYEESTGQFKGSNCDGAVGRLMSPEDFKNPLLRNFTAIPCPSGQLSIKELNLWLPRLNNTATATPAYWNMRTITTEEAASANKCFQDPSQITGIVTTNSTVYTSGPPAYDKSTGQLDYQVAAPHFMQDGTTPFKGVYNLVIRSDVARCIYGFSQAPISGTISVISENGEQQLATTVVGEKDGWMYLSATNFEFSSPKVAVKLTQAKPLEVTKPGYTSTTKSQIKKITCIKGKTTRVITGSKPVCPTGYRLSR